MLTQEQQDRMDRTPVPCMYCGIPLLAKDWPAHANDVHAAALHGKKASKREKEKYSDGRTPGQIAYERELILRPFYEDGALRKTWAQLGEIERYSWDCNPTSRFV